MKSLCLLTLCIFMTLTSHAQQPDCKSFKNGTFRIFNKSGNTTIIRKGSKQTEIVDMTGQKIVLNVKWTDDCTYVLSVPKSKKQPLLGGDNADLVVKIVSVKEDSYSIEATSENDPKIHRMEIVRVKR